MESELFCPKKCDRDDRGGTWLRYVACCDDRDDRARPGWKKVFDRGVWWGNV